MFTNAASPTLEQANLYGFKDRQPLSAKADSLRRLTFMSYKQQIIKAMNLLAEDIRVIFVGQNVIYGGAVAIEETLKDIPDCRKVELPITEDLQLGLCLGLSLLGFLPVSVFPRIDFLILATNQLVNHLDKIEQMSCGQWRPRVIIRTTIGSTSPLHPGPQHCQDHTEGLRSMLTNVDVVKLTRAEDIVSAYKRALESETSTVLIEVGNLYNV